MAKTFITRPGTDFQSILLNLQAYWAKQGAVILQPYDMKWGRALFIRQQRCAPLALIIIGVRPMCSRRGGLPMGVLERTRTGCSTFINSRRS